MPKRYLFTLYGYELFNGSFLKAFDLNECLILPTARPELLEAMLEVLPLDLVIFHEDRLDQARRVIKNSEYKAKVLAITDNPSKDHHKKLRERGAENLLVMPESSHRIMAKIKRLCPKPDSQCDKNNFPS